MTDALSVIVIAGPPSRTKLLSILEPSYRDAVREMKHMDHLDVEWGGQTMKILRASFSGELAFEVYCRPENATLFWDKLHDCGLRPYGLEALDILRIEKGYLTAAELNGQTSPLDLGMGRLAELNPDCLGRSLLDRPGMVETCRPRLIGLCSKDPTTMFIAGAQLVSPQKLGISCGHVTSAAFSPTLKAWIGLALVSGNLAVEGSELIACDPLHHRETIVRITPTTQFDPTNERMKT